ncbi:MAG: DUF814 domain-containing protein [candidate division Zixibacteria bacterium]|nr:DUF814 domain-containing protein [candidate division Zixibacteria bacterium]
MSLIAELTGEFADARIEKTEFYRKERAAYFFIKGGKTRLALGFVYHPAGAGTFCIPASKVTVETREKPWPIFSIREATIRGLRQLELDRVFEVAIDIDGNPRRLLFEALGPNGNIWLLDDSGNKLATLRKKDFTEGEPYEVSPMGDRLDPFDLTGDSFAQALTSSGLHLPATFIQNNVSGFNRTMGRDAVVRAGVEDVYTEDLEPEEIDHLAGTIRDIAERFRNPDRAYLYTVKRSLEAYPYKLSLVDSPPERFKSLSLAVANIVRFRQTVAEEEDEERNIVAAISRAVKRLRRRQKNIERDITEAEGYEDYKRRAELLQLNRDQLKKGMDTITVDDIMSDPLQTVEITLDPALAPNDNIEVYFRRHRKGREGLDLLQRRLQITKDELTELEAMQSDFTQNFDRAKEQYAQELASLLPKNVERRETLPRLPYREAVLSTGITIFIGRDGADNDRTTFDFARPYELWFHTQQCAGSHVVMKFPNKSFVPTAREIEETAAVAAFHSKARKNALVPVIYTQRRYVRKPRKAKPGLVTVERETSVMVEPIKETTEK